MYHRGYGCGSRGGPMFRNTAPVNIVETEMEYVINLYAPSLNKEDISVTSQHNILFIRYKGKAAEENTRFTRREYRVEEIDRSFDLKGRVQVDAIKAAYADGVLKVNLPKTEAVKRPAEEVAVR